jgi:histidyl-tRNA synthetase
MAKLTAKTPKGMRDFLPAEMHRREYVFSVMREVFESFGFEPISTPVMELRQTLMGSDYGEDAEKLIYQAQHTQGKEELALRYDLTVPLSRYFAEHENELSIPFRRYHIAPVWRGERPGRGRYREFLQCDADIVGIRSMAADAECVNLVYTMLKRLGFQQFTIKMNTRKLLTGIGIYAGVADEQLGSLYRSIDKTDKIGLDKVGEELVKNGIAQDAVTKIIDLLRLSAMETDKSALLAQVRQTLTGIDAAEAGLQELESLVGFVRAFGVPDEYTALDFTMVRGLGYYTGPIFETAITEPEDLGSVQGGGRYDEMIGMFRHESLPTTGISFGIERIIDLMDQLDLYPPSILATSVEVLVTIFGEETLSDAMHLATELRAAGINTEAYLDERKSLGKQFGYAEGKGIPLAVILGTEEIAQGVVKIKQLAARQESTVARADASQHIKQLLGRG